MIVFLDDEEEKNLRRISYLQATKEERMDVEDKSKKKKPKPKPVEIIDIEPRKLSEPFVPKPIVRKLPTRKLSEALILPSHQKYAFNCG